MTHALLLLVAVQAAPSTWGEALSWSDGARSRKAWVSPELVAEPAPSDATAQAVREVDPEATVVLEQPTMRLWRVRDAAALREKLPALRPVLHDLPSRASRQRVPLGLACRGKAQGLPWREALARSGQGGCTTNFWMPPVTK